MYNQGLYVNSLLSPFSTRQHKQVHLVPFSKIMLLSVTHRQVILCSIFVPIAQPGKGFCQVKKNLKLREKLGSGWVCFLCVVFIVIYKVGGLVVSGKTRIFFHLTRPLTL